MTEVLKEVFDRVHLLLLLIGVVFMVPGVLDLRDLKSWSVAPRSSPGWLPISVGAIFVAISVSLVMPRESPSWLAIGLAVLLFVGGVAFWLLGRRERSRLAGSGTPTTPAQRHVKETRTGWTMTVGQTTLNITFGRLEELSGGAPRDLVVLPANEYFDDECITDTRSALGAFVARRYPHQREDLLTIVREKLVHCKTTREEWAEGSFKESYGVGSSAFLPRALDTPWNLLLVAVTSQRAGEGLRTEIGTVFQVVRRIEKAMMDHRLDRVFVPLIGSGHGGLQPRAALSAVLVAFIEALRRPSGHAIRTIEIVIFRAVPDAESAVGHADAGSLAERAMDIYR